MRLIYNATRKIAPGHVADQEVEIAMGHAEALPQDRQDSQSRTALDGSEERDLHNITTEWAVTTDHLSPAQVALFREFFASLAAGETCIFDPDSDIEEVDVSPVTCLLVSTNHGPTRVAPQRFTYQFRLKEVV